MLEKMRHGSKDSYFNLSNFVPSYAPLEKYSHQGLEYIVTKLLVF